MVSQSPETGSNGTDRTQVPPVVSQAVEAGKHGTASKPDLSRQDLQFAHEQAQSLSQRIHEITLQDHNAKESFDYSMASQARGPEFARNAVSRKNIIDVRTAEKGAFADLERAYPDEQKRELIKSQILQDPLMKGVLPELALLEIQDCYRDSNEGLQKVGLSRDDLTVFLNRNKTLLPVSFSNLDKPDSFTELSKAALKAVLDNFDQFSRLSSASNPNGISLAAAQKGLMQLGGLESQIQDLKVAPDHAQVLHYLNDHFDDIRFGGKDQLCPVDLEAYYKQKLSPQDPMRDLISNVVSHFNDFTWLDPADGDKLASRLWLQRGNAPCITHQDIAAGLKQIGDNPARIAETQKRIDNWLNW